MDSQLQMMALARAFVLQGWMGMGMARRMIDASRAAARGNLNHAGVGREENSARRRRRQLRCTNRYRRSQMPGRM
jgi:hypothetical protein